MLGRRSDDSFTLQSPWPSSRAQEASAADAGRRSQPYTDSGGASETLERGLQAIERRLGVSPETWSEGQGPLWRCERARLR